MVPEERTAAEEESVERIRHSQKAREAESIGASPSPIILSRRWVPETKTWTLLGPSGATTRRW